MARMRYVKPEYWTDSKIIRLSPWARLLYIGSWNFAICEVGHLDDDAMALKLKVLPADPIDADEVLEEIITAGRIVRKALPDGRTYLVIPRLPNHQKTETRWGTRCPYCAAEAPAPKPAETPPSSPNLSEPLPTSTEVSHTPRNSAQEGIGGEGIGEKNIPAPRPEQESLAVVTPIGATDRKTLDEHFAEVYGAYPRKVGKSSARTAWDKARKRAPIDVILAGAIRFRDDPNLHEDKNFIPHPSTWFARGGWEDEPCPPRDTQPDKRPTRSAGRPSAPEGW